MKKDEVNTQEVQEVQEVQPERVAITIPRGDKRDDSNLFVSVNGVNYLLPRGKTSLVPPEVAQEVRRHFPGKVFATSIPRNVRLAEAPSHGIPVTAYDRASRGAVAYQAMAEEIKGKL